MAFTAPAYTQPIIICSDGLVFYPPVFVPQPEVFNAPTLPTTVLDPTQAKPHDHQAADELRPTKAKPV